MDKMKNNTIKDLLEKKSEDITFTDIKNFMNLISPEFSKKFNFWDIHCLIKSKGLTFKDINELLLNR